MGYTVLSLYVDETDREIARNKGINMSQLFRDSLSAELKVWSEGAELSKEEQIQKFRAETAKLIGQLKASTDKIAQLQKELAEAKQKALPASKILRTITT